MQAHPENLPKQLFSPQLLVRVTGYFQRPGITSPWSLPKNGIGDTYVWCWLRSHSFSNHQTLGLAGEISQYRLGWETRSHSITVDVHLFLAEYWPDSGKGGANASSMLTTTRTTFTSTVRGLHRAEIHDLAAYQGHNVGYLCQVSIQTF